MAPRGLFVTDLDGTLFSFETHEMPEANRRAIERATRAGVVVAVATGRRRESYLADSHRLAGLPHRVSLSNGAVLLAEDNHEPELVHEIPWEATLQLARLTRAGVHGLLAILAPRAREAECWVLRPDGRAFTAGSPWRAETHVERPLDEATSRPLVHAALHVASRELAESLEVEARSVFAGADVEIHSVRSPGGGGALLEVVVAGGKGRGLRDLARAQGVPLELTGAIGDDMNDARMLQAARWRYAVGGSVLARREPGVIEVANAEAGAVAEALDHFVERLAVEATCGP